MKITIQYFDGCPHWRLADRRLADVLRRLDRDELTIEYQLIESPEMAERVGFRGSPTILIDGRDPFATGAEPIGLSCRVFRTEHGAQGAPTETQLREVLEGGSSAGGSAAQDRDRFDGNQSLGDREAADHRS